MSVIQQGAMVAGAGAVMTCPKCHAKIGTLRKPLFQNHNFGLDIVRFEPGQEPKASDPKAQCRICDTAYAEKTKSMRHGLQNFIHTEFGWLPPEQSTVADAVAGQLHRVQ